MPGVSLKAWKGILFIRSKHQFCDLKNIWIFSNNIDILHSSESHDYISSHSAISMAALVAWWYLCVLFSSFWYRLLCFDMASNMVVSQRRFLLSLPLDGSIDNIEVIDVESSPSQVQHRVLLFWFTAILSPCVVWWAFQLGPCALYNAVWRSARISLGFLVSRFVPIGSKARRNLFIIWLFFGIIWLSIMIEKVLVCRSDSVAQRTSYVHCTDGKSTGIISLCSKINSSDIWNLT